MSVRVIAVISVSESKVLFYRTFPTVENRFIKQGGTSKLLPDQQSIIQPLFKELGLVNSGIFQSSRDTCTKQIQVPLFWVPYNDAADGYWPAVVIEKSGLLFCAVPSIKTESEIQPPDLLQCTDVTVAFEVLQNLAAFSTPVQPDLVENLSLWIRQWLPFGRLKVVLPSEPENLVTRRSWLRSRPQLSLTIKEEIRAILGPNNSNVELTGTLELQNEANIDLDNVDFQLSFNQLPMDTKLDILTHHSISIKSLATRRYLINDVKETKFPACCYQGYLNYTPIFAVLKTRLSGALLSLFIQLNFTALNSFMPSTLEVKLNLPQDYRISRALSVNNQNLGTVSYPRDGSQVSWSLNSVVGTSRLREDVILTVDAELNKIPENVDVFSSTYATVSFTSDQMTLSGLNVNFPGNTKFKPILSQYFRSTVYKVWNNDASDIY